MAAVARPAASSPHSLSRTHRASCPRIALDLEHRAVPAGGARRDRGRTGPAGRGGRGRGFPRRAARPRAGRRARQPVPRRAAAGARPELRDKPGHARRTGRPGRRAGRLGGRARGAGLRRVTGIIDFGDITAGDPAADLSVAWMLLPADLNGAFREAYQAHLAAGAGPADAELWRRARGWALNLALAFLAHSADNPLIHGIGDRTLRAVLA